MPRRRLKSTSSTVRIVIKSDHETLVARDSYYPVLTDHVGVCRPTEVAEVAHALLIPEWSIQAGHHELQVVCPISEKVDVNPILDVAEDLLTATNWIELYYCHVDANLFRRLVRNWNHVNLTGCALGDDWWEPPNTERKCKELSLLQCTLASPPRMSAGQAGWAELESLFLDEGQYNPRLKKKPTFYSEPYVTHASSYSCDLRAALHALWSPSIESITLSDWLHSPRLARLETTGSLESLFLNRVPMSLDDYKWIVTATSLRELQLSWRTGANIPWQRLKALFMLSDLDLSDSPCTDEDLEAILQHTHLRSISLFYSRTSPVSWKKLFMERTLRSIWASTEMITGDVPDDLPAKTNVREVVALNASVAKAKELVKRYPRVKVVGM